MMLDAALDYAERGWPVLPLWWPVRIDGKPACACPGTPERPGGADCKSAGKHPLTVHGLRDATRDGFLIAEWWHAAPMANVGILLGQEANLFALDVDPRAGGDRVLVDLVTKHGPLGDTLHAFTGSGGDHYFFRWPGRRVFNRKIAPGLDIKGDGGYVVAAPSMHASGGRYHWSWDAAGEVRDAPPWLCALMARPEPESAQPSRKTLPRTEAALRASLYLEKMAPSVSGSGGHAAAMRAALALVQGFCLTEADALDLLVHEFNPRCSPPWSIDELKHKVSDAAKSTSVPNGYLLEDA